MAKPESKEQGEVVLRLVFDGRTINIRKSPGQQRFTTDTLPRAGDEFIGVQVMGKENHPLLECPGEQAFWMVGHKTPSPPENALPINDWNLGAGGVEAFTIWLRLPNALLPTHYSVQGRNDLRDGHYSWFAINMHHRGSRAVWIMAVAAGGDIGNWLGVKNAKWGETMSAKDLKTAGFFLWGKDEIPLKTVEQEISFAGAAPQLAVPAPIPRPSPQTPLISACEQIIGISARVNPDDVKVPLSPLMVSWQLEPLSGESAGGVFRLVMRREFVRTPSAAEPAFQLSDAERSKVDRSRLRFTLMQHSRPLASCQQNTSLPRWYLQASFRKPDGLSERDYLDELANQFARGWEGLIGAGKPDAMSQPVSALFSLKPKLDAWNAAWKSSVPLPAYLPVDWPKDNPLTSEILQWRADAFNPMPLFDVVPEPGYFRKSQPYAFSPNAASFGQIRLEARPPELRHILANFQGNNQEDSVKLHCDLTWLYLRDHLRRPLVSDAWIIANVPLDPKTDPLGNNILFDESGGKSWLLKWQVHVGFAGKGHDLPLRAGALDLVPLAKEPERDPSNLLDWCHCQFFFRQQARASQRWDTLEPQRLHFHALGWETESVATIRQKKSTEVLEVGGVAWTPLPDAGLRIPLDAIRPGETDHHEAETELLTTPGGPRVSAERPLVINIPNLKQQEPKLQGKWVLELQEIAGTTFTRQLTLSIKVTGDDKPTEGNNRSRRVVYVDRTPFFVGLFEMGDVTQFPREEGNEAAYFSTKGVFRGWQLRSTRYDFLLHLPPQGIGEAMEKGRRGDGYSDIEEGDTVDFRFAPVSTLTVKGSDMDRRYGPVPWDLRLLLNSLKDNRLVGLPLKAAEFEMLYGLRMKIELGEQTQYLRIAELLARMGWPRSSMHFSAVNLEYWDNPNPNPNKAALVTLEGPTLARMRYEEVRDQWSNLLEAIGSRLAVYEVFDDRQLDFNAKGEPVGLTLQGDGTHPGLSAELRKSARLRVSMAAEPTGKTGDADASSEAGSNKDPLQLLQGETLKYEIQEANRGQLSVHRDWWAKLIPNYDDGLAGSFAWAFESRLLYESMWASDPQPNTIAVVEAVEATLARLYFSALGGWSSQRAAFANGKIVVVVNVEMGRVSELRVEVIGRIGVLWNKAKLVTVFRRSVLPSDQFQDQQDLHEGRPLLRKVEEYVEFLEKYRLANDAGALRDAANAKISDDDALTKAGCLKACSCEEKILVDARWGKDIYDDNGRGLGFKVPLRKPGLNKRIYGPANLLLHFYANDAGPTAEVSGRVENLENVVFWTDTRLDTTADTNKWKPIDFIDVFPAISHDTVNHDVTWSDPKEANEWNDRMVWGTPPVSWQTQGCTFRVAGLTKEASLNKHLLKGVTDPEGERPVGSIIRNVTLSRGSSAATGQVESNPGDSPPGEASDNVHDWAASLHAANEHVLGFLEQVATPVQEAGEQVFGWQAAALQDLTGIVGDVQAGKIIDDLHPLMSGETSLAERADEFKLRVERDMGHFFDLGTNFKEPWENLLNTLRDQGTTAVDKQLETLQKVIPSGDDLAKLVGNLKGKLNDLFSKAQSALADLKTRADDWTGVTLKKLLVDTSKSAATDATKLFTSSSEFLRLENAVKQALADIGSKADKTDQILRQQIETPLRGALAAQLHKRLMELEKQVKDDENRRKKVLDIAQALAGQCVNNEDPVDNLDQFRKDLDQLWNQKKDNLEASIILLAARYLTDTTTQAQESSQALTWEFRTKLRPNLVENLDGLVVAIKAKIKTLDDLLSKAGESHSKLVPLIQQGIQDWVYAKVEPGKDAAAKFLNALGQHCKEQCASGQQVLADISALAQKHLSAVDRVRQALNNTEALKGKVDAVLNKYKDGVKNAEQGWIAKSQRLKTDGWKALTDKLAKAEQSPLRSVASRLQGMQASLKSLGETPEKLKNLTDKFKGNLEKNALNLANRANRELRGVSDQMVNAFNQIKAQARTESEAIEQFQKNWLAADAPLLKRTLQNITGTAEHARLAIERGKSILDTLSGKIAALPQKLETVAEAQKKEIRDVWQAWMNDAEALAQQVKLPWLEGLPKKLRPEALVAKARRVLAQLETVTKGTLEAFNSDLEKEKADINKLATEAGKALADVKATAAGRISAISEGVLKDLNDKLNNKSLAEATNILRAYQSTIAADVDAFGKRLSEGLQSSIGQIFELDPNKAFESTIQGLGIDAEHLRNRFDDVVTSMASRIPSIQHLERGAAELQDWMNHQRESLALVSGEIHDLLDVKKKVGEAEHAVIQTFRAFGQVPKVPALNFKDMATLDKLKDFKGDVKNYVNNINARVCNVSYAFRQLGKDSEKAMQDALRITPVKSMVDRLKKAGGDVVEEARLRAATVETAVRNLGQKVEADAQRMIDNLKPSLKDLLPDFGGLKLEKLLTSAGLGENFIKRFQQKLVTRHGLDPQTKSGFVDSRLDDLLLDDSLTIVSFGPLTLRLRNVKLSAHLRVEGGAGQEIKRQSDGRLVADWEILVGGQAVITYVQAALENKDGHTKMDLDPKKVRMPSILQTVADVMKSHSAKDDSGLQAGVINNLPTDVSGYVKFNLDIPSAGAGTTGIQNLRISLFFELALRFPRFPSLRDADLRISAGVGLSDQEAPFIIAIWILGGCGWFQVRLDYVVPFQDGSPNLDVYVSFGLGVSVSLAFDVGFASGSVYVALMVKIECTVHKGKSNFIFSIVLTIGGNLNLLGIVTVNLLIVLSIGYTSPGPMIGTGTIRVSIKICWCFTLHLERSFTKTFSGGGQQSLHAPGDGVHRIAASSPDRVPVPDWNTMPQREPVIQHTVPAKAHRKAARMIV